MKTTGIIRRIDDLGRVVIPKEMRRTLKLREGDPLEESIVDGGIFLKKYSPVMELGDFTKEYVESLYETTNHIALITDRDVVIAVAGCNKREFLGKQIGKAVEKVIEEGESISYAYDMNSEESHIIQMDGEKYLIRNELIVPIACQGDILGTVIIATKEENIIFEQLDWKMAGIIANIIGKQMQ